MVAVNAGLGVVSSSLMARFYGADRSVDALVMAQGIAAMATKLVLLDKLPVVLLPILMNQRRADAERAWRVASATALVTAAVSALLSMAAILGAIPLVDFLAAGFGPEARTQTVFLLQLTIPAVFITGLNAVLATILQTVRHFLWPFVLEGVFRSLTIIGILVWASQVGVELLAALNLASALGICLVQIGLLLQLSRGQVLHPRWSRDEARQTFSMWWPYMRSTWSQLIGLGANRNAASHLGVGSVAALGYAERVFTLLAQLSSQGVATVVTQDLAHDAAARDYPGFARRLLRTASVLLKVTVPLVVVTALLSERIVRVLFGRGQFLTHDQASETSVLLATYAVLLLPEISSRFGGSALQALGLTRAIVWNAVAANLVQAAAYIALPLVLGSPGIVLAMILGRATATALAGVSLARHRIQLGLRSVLGSAGETLVAGGVSTLVGLVLVSLSGNPSTATTLQQMAWITVVGGSWLTVYAGVLLFRRQRRLAHVAAGPRLLSAQPQPSPEARASVTLGSTPSTSERGEVTH